MIYITHISDGHKHFHEAISDYIKRLNKDIKIFTIKNEKHTHIPYIKQKETEKILAKIEKFSGTIFLCDERGKHISTMDFAKKIENLHHSSEDIMFIIGGSYGFDYEILSKIPKIQSIKLSEMVLPHSLAFLVLIEQIYRAKEIIKGSGYHHI